MAIQVRGWLALLVCAVAMAAALGEQLKERKVLEKTPTPCKKEYDASFITKAAEEHLHKYGCTSDRGDRLDKQRMLLLLGGSGAGKGTFLRHVTKAGLDLSKFVPHGLDEYLQYLPEYAATAADPDHVYKDAADACYGGGAIPIAQAAQKLLISRSCDLFYEETGKNLDRVLKRVLPPYTNYTISMVLVDSLPSVAIERSAGRFQKEGRYAPDDYIEGSFKNVFENYKTLRTNALIKEAVYCDNSCVGVEGKKGPGDCMHCWAHTNGDAQGFPDGAIPSAALLSVPLKFMVEKVHDAAFPSEL